MSTIHAELARHGVCSAILAARAFEFLDTCARSGVTVTIAQAVKYVLS